MKKKLFLITICLAIGFFSGCTTQKTFEPTGTQSPTLTPKPTSTLTPTPTITPTPIGKSSGKIIFNMAKSENESNKDIIILNLNTLEVSNLTNNENDETSYEDMSISPDGKRIVFTKETDFKTMILEPKIQLLRKYELYIMSIDGTNIEKLTSIPIYRGKENIADRITEFNPAWSPDGKKIAFASNRDQLITRGNQNDLEIFVVELETFEIKKLTNTKGYNQQPSWSPDGKYITFATDRDGDWEIYYMNSDGTGEDLRITKNRTSERRPIWSNDGKYIAYYSDRDGNTNIYIYDFENKTETQLTDHRGNEYTGDWSPDDNWILFESDKDGDAEVFIINLKTKEQHQLTDDKVSEAYINWIPDNN